MTAAKCLNGSSIDINIMYFDVQMYLITGILCCFRKKGSHCIFFYVTVICNMLLFVENKEFLIPDCPSANEATLNNMGKLIT